MSQTTQTSPKTEILKKQILAKEEVKEYSSSRFEKIEEKVLSSLARQATDDALKDISL